MKTYPLFKVHVDTPRALRLLEGVLNSGYINEGTQVTQLTEALQGRWGTENLSLTNSCTSALVLALRLAGVGPGDEVITTPMTCVATSAAISALGAVPLWADVDPESGMISARDVVGLMGTHHVKAVVAVAWAGTPPDLDGLDFVRRTGTKLVLDAAHAFDALYRHVPVHEWADYTCYSFQAIKHFTCGDGGALVCADRDDHLRAKALKWFGIDRDKAKDAAGDWRCRQWDVDIPEIGYKSNMNNVAAAIGLSQLPHIDRIVLAHRRNAALYDTHLNGCEWLRPAARPNDGVSSSWVYTVRLDPSRCPVSRDEAIACLNAQGIMAGVVHVPNDTYSCYRTPWVPRALPGLKAFSENQLSLPCGWWLDAADIKHISRAVMALNGRG